MDHAEIMSRKRSFGSHSDILRVFAYFFRVHSGLLPRYSYSKKTLKNAFYIAFVNLLITITRLWFYCLICSKTFYQTFHISLHLGIFYHNWFYPIIFGRILDTTCWMQSRFWAQLVGCKLWPGCNLMDATCWTQTRGDTMFTKPS